MLATAIFPDMLVGRLYDQEAARQHPDVHSHDLSCSGGVCFRMTFQYYMYYTVEHSTANVANALS
jgi:hypothetical protein